MEQEEKKLPERLENAAQDSADLLQQRQKNYNPTYWCGAYDGFIAGAKYQRKQDQQLIELAEDHAMLAGMNKMKEEMMEKAVEGEVCGRVYDHINVRFADGVCKYLEPKNISHIPADVSKFKVGDKVRVIAIPEENLNTTQNEN